MSILVNCLILGDDPDNVFSVEVPKTAYVSALREGIKAKKEPSDKELVLWMVNFPLNDLESKLENLNLGDYQKLIRQKVSTFFVKDPSPNCLHIIAIAHGILNLFCAIEAKDMTWQNIFSVNIYSRNTVGDLKDAIKEMMKPHFDHFSANELDLFKVSIPVDVEESLNVDLESSKFLGPSKRLLELFPCVDEDHLHIIIRVPIVDGAITVKEEGEGRDQISGLHKRFHNFISGILKATSPSDLAKSSAYAKSQIACSIFDGRYKADRPRTSVAPPIQLFHPVFARFLDDMKGTGDVSKDIIRATTRYMMAASAIYTSEEERRVALTPLLCAILGINIRTIMNEDETSADGVVELSTELGSVLLYLQENKNEFGDGSSDPSTQAGLSAGRYWAQPKYENLRNATNCATFLIATAGPWIVILGSVLTDGLIVQRLTDYIWVGLDSVSNENHISRVARTFYALKNSLSNLKSYYDVPQPTNFPAGYRYFPSITAYCVNNSDDLIHFQYVGFLEDVPDCITFRARTSANPPQDIVVKFVNHYGERAHRLLAENGLAPELFYCGSPRLTNEDPSYNSLSMIVMGFVDGKTLGKLKLDEDTAKTVRSEIERALALLHENGLVYGDLRLPNIIITKAERKVNIIDFDWAGEKGQARYPFLISPGIPWPAGVKSLALIEPEHDLKMLKQMFSEPVPFITRV